MVTVENLEKDLRQGVLNSIYLLYGEETFLLETCLKKIKTNFGELKEGINYIKIDDTSVDKIISELETPAFGYEKKIIIARDCALFKKETKKKTGLNLELSNKIAQYIQENIKQIRETSILVFVEQETEKNDLYKVIDNLGLVCNFESLKLSQVMVRIKAICNAYKVNITESTLSYFLENVGLDMQNVINEIRKLIEFVGAEGTIKKEDVDKLSIKQLDSVIFDLTDNLGKKNIEKSLEVLNNLLYQKEPIQKILVTLYNHFKKLYIVKLSEKYNKNIAESLNLKPNQSFLVGKYRSQSAYFKESELRKILYELIDLDYNYKIGKIDINIGLETILCCF